ncbi:hypothetical protein [Microbacterium sp.]|uniref:hypothetical protein n=1 Tax=Microbacterium sp. TaxID=51671 RepID=UPI00356A21C4
MSGSSLNSKPIGSDFESLSQTETAELTIPPWGRDGRRVAYLETGRQALRLVAETLSKQGRNQLLVPGLLCESMIEPFIALGWGVTSLGLSDDLGLPENAIRMLGEEPERTVILLAAYFGRSPDRVHQAIAHEAKRLGVVVIEDETHRVFRPGSEYADYSFASLRKLLPVGDGAYLKGDDEVLQAASLLGESDSLRWTAMDAKRDALRDDSDSDYRTLFIQENKTLERTGRLQRASSRSVDTIAVLPYEAMAQARLVNAAHLRARLTAAAIDSFQTVDGDVPSHLVLSVDEPKRLQAGLAARGVYGAIHWPRVTGVAGLAAWRSDLFSVPIDHRYDRGDMERVARAIIQEIKR